MTPSTHSCRSPLETSLRRNTSYGTYSCGFAAVTARAYQDPSASPAWRSSNANTTDAAECGGEGSCVCLMGAERVVSIARIEVRPVRRQGAARRREPRRCIGAPPGNGEARHAVGRVAHDDALAR